MNNELIKTKPISPNVQMNLSLCFTMNYEQRTMNYSGKNKPKQSQRIKLHNMGHRAKYLRIDKNKEKIIGREVSMEGLEYLHELCEALPRCGPGDNDSTRRAYNAIPNPPEKPFILDIGCGTGMQTLELARISNGDIIALDNHQEFLDILMKNAIDEGLQNRIVPKNMSMLEMDFANQTFDIIWSEGALFCMGFNNGVKRCHELLKADGYLAVTELVYIASDLPKEVTQYFGNVYPDIDDIQGNIEAIQKAGFNLISNFTLPEFAWLDNYYLPAEKILPGLNKKYQGNETALRIFEDFQNEISLYKKYSKFYGYEFFIMQKVNK